MADNKKAAKPVAKSATKPVAKTKGRPLVEPKTPPIKAADVIAKQGGPAPMKVKGALFGLRKGRPSRGR
ncbi:hypothetical protein UFOVP223_95 [uncultured Caudovirales phage]|uniref:Uncharacterized protein n=1 Tax=uncultured Caudovirales phage TaxID=2100421 RepID=A0A6J5L7L4_9CAUD|nr:hypothetical protein UFOVP110_69 [uncultured Caudovirales phage]CAB5219570.1 hypothetical protein UFOVP223_95 [uncultured Caudovirales phage]